MSVTMLWIVSGCYLLAAVDMWSAGRPGLALLFVGYTAANLGMIWEVFRPTTGP